MAKTTFAGSWVRGRVVTYLILAAALTLIALWLPGSAYRGHAAGHTVLETVAALLALFAGLVAIIHYATGHSARYLFIGSAFLGAALLDGYHAIVTSAWFPLVWPAPPQSLLAWSWYPSRLLLAVLFIMLWRRDARREEEDTMPRAREQWAVYLPVGLMTLASFALFALIDLPEAYADEGLLGRPQELVTAALFLLALAGFVREGHWRRTALDHYLVLFLILSVAAQALFMVFARENHDAMFAAAHVTKIGSYSVVLLGLLRNMHGVLWQAREDARALEIHARELERHVARRTAEMHDTAESFRLLFASNPHPMWVFDVETLAFLEVNDAAVSHYGYSREAFLSMRISDIRPDEDVPRLLETVSGDRRPLNRGSEWRHRLRDGRVIDVEIASHALTFESRPARLVIAQDITERKRADQLLRASEERFRAVVQNAMDMVTVIQPDGVITYDSPAVQRVLGYAPEERLGRSAESFTHPDDAPEVQEKLAEVAAKPGAQVTAQLRVRHRNGAWRIVEVTGTNMTHNEALRGIVINWHDVTERVQGQQEIERLNTQLEERVRRRTEQLEAANKELEAFAYSVSHDLRAPLRAMDGFARILLGESADELSDNAQRYLKRIRHNAQQMDQLIQDLLAFSRLNRQEFRRKAVQPDQLVREALANLEEEMEGRQIDILVQPLPQIQADPTLLRVVFANLLSNALKYTRMREPARIEVGVEQPGGEGANSPQGGATVFFVRDNGVGFDMKYADKLFGVFQRLHRAEEYEGTGVGLATVQRIVRRHGGRVWVYAAVDQGATVYFTLEET